jgi:hypothetical protein
MYGEQNKWWLILLQILKYSPDKLQELYDKTSINVKIKFETWKKFSWNTLVRAFLIF